MLRKLAIAGVASLSLMACTTTERNVGTGAAVGAGTGAVAGALITGDAGGALVGAAVGGIAGAAIGAAVSDRPGYCYAVDRNGRQIYDRGGQPVTVQC
jgi:hypothetical protein